MSYRLKPNSLSLESFFLDGDLEKRLREIFAEENVLNYAHKVGDEHVPPYLDYADIVATQGDTELYHAFDTWKIFEEYCRTCVTLSRGQAAEAQQRLYGNQGVIYCFYAPDRMHVIGVAYVDGQGKARRRVVLCSQLVQELLICAPPQLIELATASACSARRSKLVPCKVNIDPYDDLDDELDDELGDYLDDDEDHDDDGIRPKLNHEIPAKAACADSSTPGVKARARRPRPQKKLTEK